MINKFLCLIGMHKIDSSKWKDNLAWGEHYLGQTNWCERCGKFLTRK